MSETALPDRPIDQVQPSPLVRTNQQPATVKKQEWVTSKQEKVSSLLMAASIFATMLVAFLFLMWLTSSTSPQIAVVTPEPKPGKSGSTSADGQLQFETPETREVQELLEPSLELRLATIADAVSTVAVTFRSTDGDLPVQPTSSSRVRGHSGPANGGSQGVGEDFGFDADIVPRFERWKLRFVAKDLAQYSKQLDSFGIELAAIGGEIQGIHYAADLASKPITRHGPSRDEKRLYFMWTSSSPLANFDKQLLQKAGVDLQKRMILKFIPLNLENLMAHLELEYAKGRGISSVTQISETVFESKQSEGGYQFEVVSQAYRKPRN